MTRPSDYSDQDYRHHQNSGFIFGLICGAIISALIAIIIYKNNKTEIFEKLEQKIKHFFDNISPSKFTSKSKPKSPRSKPKNIMTPSLSKKDITPIFVKTKTPPKMFIKPKK